MSISIVQSSGYNTGSSDPTNPTITLTLGSSPTVGNLLVVFFGLKQDPDETVATPSEWTLIAYELETDTPDCAIWAGYHYVQSGDGTTYDFPLTGGDYVSAVIYEISGAASSDPIADWGTSSNTSTSITSASLTPTTLNNLALGCVTSNAGSLYSQAESSLSSGWTLDQTQVPDWHASWSVHQTALTSDTSTAISFTMGLAVYDQCMSILMLIQPPRSPLSGYSYYRAITIDHTKCGSSDSVAFPVLLAGTYSWLADTANGGHVQSSNGYDIAFTSDSAGQNVLNWEVESYDATTGAAIFWVQVPTVSSSADTVIYIWYGNSAITTDQSAKPETWDPDYMGVWHQGTPTSASASDSTAHGNNGTIHGATATTGKIGGATAYAAASSQYVDVPNTQSLEPTAAVTLSCWIKPASSQPDGYANPAGCLTDGGGDGYGFWLNDTSPQPYAAIGGSNVELTSSLATGTWSHLVLTYDGSTQSIYLNGALNNSASYAVSPLPYSGTDLYLGTNGTRGDFFNGDLDEVRVSSIARSADWILTEYNNQNSPSTFYSVGNEQSAGGSYTQILSDTLTILSSLTKKPGKSFSSVITLTSSLTKTPKKALSDTITLVSRLVKTPKKVLSGSLSLLDSLYKLRTAHVIVSDVISLSDSIAKHVSKAVTDTLNVVDAYMRINLTLVFGDMLTLVDAIVRHSTRHCNDAFTLTDSIAKHIGRKVSDAISLADGIAKRTDKGLSEYISLMDHLRRGITKPFSDTVIMTDRVTRGIAKLLLDAISIRETFSSLVTVAVIRKFFAQLWRRCWPAQCEQRVWQAENYPRTFCASTEEVMILDVTKPSGSTENFEIDWTDVVTSESGTVDPIQSSAWSATPNDMVVSSSTYTTTTATVRISAGTIGTRYVVVNTVTLGSGQIKTQSLLITVTE